MNEVSKSMRRRAQLQYDALVRAYARNVRNVRNDQKLNEDRTNKFNAYKQQTTKHTTIKLLLNVPTIISYYQLLRSNSV